MEDKTQRYEVVQNVTFRHLPVGEDTFMTGEFVWLTDEQAERAKELGLVELAPEKKPVTSKTAKVKSPKKVDKQQDAVDPLPTDKPLPESVTTKEVVRKRRTKSG